MINGLSQYGVLADPSAAVTVPGGVYVRGGTTGANASLTDSHVESLGEMAAWDDSSSPKNGPPGYAVIAPAIRGSDPSYTGKGVSAGTDEFGGDDVDDVIQAQSLLLESGATASPSQPKVRSDQLFGLGASAGAMRLLHALRRGMLMHACVLRSPFLKVLDWDAVDGTNQANISAMISGFTSGPPADVSGLDFDDFAALEARSPAVWDPRELPDIPYLIVHGDQDTTSLMKWSEEFADRMKDAGRTVHLRSVPQGDHQWTNADADSIATNTIRAFLASVFRS
jgi:dipeptidyl aminopeptidase/acylaminoacyl peptidase